MAPGFTLVTSPPAELERALARGVARAQSQDPLAPVTVLIGGTLLRPYLGRRLAELNGGIANVSFTTPSELALATGERAQVATGRTPLPPLADRILLREIALEGGGYFEPVRTMPGFGDALHRLVRELRGAGYAAGTFERAIERACDVPDKGAALASLLRRFLARRAAFYGPDDCMLSASPEELDASALAVYGMWDAPAALRRVLEAIAERIPVHVYLPRIDAPADDAHAPLRAWLEAVGATVERVEKVDVGAEAAGALRHLQRGLFAERRAAAPLDGSVELVSGPDPSREVREVARACIGWARDGMRFHEMAVVYRNADDYRPLIEAVFREAGIPLYLHEGTPLIERPLGRRVAALLDLIGSRLERRAVMDFLTDADLPKATCDAYDGAPAARWDKLSRAAGVVEDIAQWDDRLSRLAGELAADTPEEVPAWVLADAGRVDDLRRFVLDLDAALRDHADSAPWSEQLAALRRLLVRYVKDPSAVLDALRPLERFDALGDSVSFERFRDVVRSALESLRSDAVLGTRAGRFGGRGVNVLDANSARQLRFRAVAVVGLSERCFPPPPRQDPLLLDHERERLNSRGIAPIPLRVHGADTEPLQFALVAGAARERLLLTYPRKGSGDARPQLPSAFLREVAATLVGQAVRASEIDSLPPELHRRASGSRIGALDLARALSESERDRTLIERDGAGGRAVLERSEPRLARALAARAARLDSRLTPFDGALSAAGAAEHLVRVLDPERPLSPTGIEDYAVCPQRFFLDRVLRAKPVEEPESTTRISPPARGALIHDVLERFLSQPPPAGELLHGDAEPERLRAIADACCQAAERRGETGYPLVWAYDRQDIHEDLQRWLELEREDPTFRVLPEGAFEVRFGPRRHGGSEDPASLDEPLEVTAEGVRLRVTGRIDRLNWDRERTRFRVIDYKTGKVRDDHAQNALRGGRALQLPLYLLAGAEITGIDARHGSAEYHFPTRRGQYTRRHFDGDTLAERRSDFDRLVAGLVEGVRSGSFELAPVEDAASCRFCDFDGLCPAARHAQVRRKSGDERAVSLAHLREIE